MHLVCLVVPGVKIVGREEDKNRRANERGKRGETAPSVGSCNIFPLLSTFVTLATGLSVPGNCKLQIGERNLKIILV